MYSNAGKKKREDMEEVQLTNQECRISCFDSRCEKKWSRITIESTNKGEIYIQKYISGFLFVMFCGDLGINNKTPNRMLTPRLPHTKCINASPRIRLHASIRLKIRKKRKIIKSKVSNGKWSRQNWKDFGVANLEPVERDKYSGLL